MVTAPTSPSNSFSLQNAMSYIDKRGVVGLIPINVAGDPAAVNMPHMLRVCDIIYSPASYYMWDATNNPTGSFALQNGKRLGWGLDWTDVTPFLASDIYFSCNSDEPANALHYVGNIATNTADGSPLSFSSTLRGELWDANGNVIATYYNGEAVATHSVNRVMCLIREGYYASDTNILALDLNYFKNHIPMEVCVQFYRNNGQGASKCLSSRPWLTFAPNGIHTATFTLEGQRQLGMVYTIQGTSGDPQWHALNSPVSWNNVFTSVIDGFVYDGPYQPNGWFRVMEGSAPITPSFLLVHSKSTSLPSAQISNGPE
ncbi:MAG: hypothetical protein WCG07_02270 [Candidatus Taylorbacteria bacterium]